MISFFSRLLSDDAGNPSAIRGAAFWLTLVFAVVWGAVSIKMWTIQPVSMEMVGLIAAMWGIKVWQKPMEQKPGVVSERSSTSSSYASKTGEQVKADTTTETVNL